MQYTEAMILTKLSGGPRTANEIGRGHLTAHTEYYLSSLREKGYVIENKPNWVITKFGLEALANYKNPKTGPRKTVNSASVGRYDGAELRHRVQRRGAYDFLNCPTRFGDKLVYRPDAV